MAQLLFISSIEGALVWTSILECIHCLLSMGAITRCKSTNLRKEQLWHLLHPTQGIFCICQVSAWSWASHTRFKNHLKQWGSRSQGEGCSLGLMGKHQWVHLTLEPAYFIKLNIMGNIFAVANIAEMYERLEINFLITEQVRHTEEHNFPSYYVHFWETVL